MKPGVAVVVLSGVLLCMLGAGLSQTTDRTGNSNTAANCTEADRRPRRLANGGYWNSEIERQKNIDGNTGKTIMNGSWNADCARWDYEEQNWNSTTNAAMNSANEVPRRKKPVRKGSKRPGTGGTTDLGTELFGYLAAEIVP